MGKGCARFSPARLGPATATPTAVALFLALLCLPALVLAQDSAYPKCWIKSGECLDMNEGPLVIGVKPQINLNVIGNAISNVESLDDCVTHCVQEEECRFFTYYSDPIPFEKRNETVCRLVGWNLRQACFNLNRTCVLLRECRSFNDSCDTCQTGIRPLYDPREEQHTMVVGGVTDNRKYLEELTDQYSQDAAAENELIVNASSMCLLNKEGIIPRFGAGAGYVDGKLLVCGGFDLETNLYLPDCNKFTAKTSPWSADQSLNTVRAFFAVAVVPKVTASGLPVAPKASVMYVMGGFNADDGFLSSTEMYESVANGWTEEAGWALPEAKSHFCTVVTTKYNGTRHVYALGGWNIDYLSSVHRMELADTGLKTADAAWTELPQNMRQQRSEHACAEVQFGWRKGIMAAGGYRMDGAWLSSVEFFDYETGEWTHPSFFPQLTSGRHYHGLTTINMVPHVFGGWNDGSLNSIEKLDDCPTSATPSVDADADAADAADADKPVWRVLETALLNVKREKFAYARVPKEFMNDCSLF